MCPARRTSARRRMKRYRAKRTWKAIPERLKRLLHESPFHMIKQWEDKEPPFVFCETPTLLLLEALEVSTEEWPYYVGYMKRMLALYEEFTEATLQLEKDNLIAEYVLRGYDKEVLDEVQLVVEDCSEACYLSCEIVRACLEGDFSSWAFQWKVAQHGDEHDYNILWRADETLDKIFIRNTYSNYLTIRKLSDGTHESTTNTISTGFYDEVLAYSLLRKYFAIVVWEGGKPILRIFKDGAIIQNLDLSAAPINWGADTFILTISPDGKYILLDAFSSNEYGLFKGA